MKRASSVDFLKICAEHVLFISVVTPKHELTRRGEKQRNPGLFSFYKCFNSRLPITWTCCLQNIVYNCYFQPSV